MISPLDHYLSAIFNILKIVTLIIFSYDQTSTTVTISLLGRASVFTTARRFCQLFGFYPRKQVSTLYFYLQSTLASFSRVRLATLLSARSPCLWVIPIRSKPLSSALSWIFCALIADLHYISSLVYVISFDDHSRRKFTGTFRKFYD